jgi:hypothetical protein
MLSFGAFEVETCNISLYEDCGVACNAIKSVERRHPITFLDCEEL